MSEDLRMRRKIQAARTERLALTFTAVCSVALSGGVIAAELAKDHWFDISAARRDLGYAPRVTMAAGTAELIAALKS